MSSARTVSVSMSITDENGTTAATRTGHICGSHLPIQIGSCTGSCLMALDWPDTIEFAARTLQFVIEIEGEKSNFYAEDLDDINAIDNAVDKFLKKCDERHRNRLRILGEEPTDDDTTGGSNG